MNLGTHFYKNPDSKNQNLEMKGFIKMKKQSIGVLYLNQLK
jgi:hypothetical protein